MKDNNANVRSYMYMGLASPQHLTSAPMWLSAKAYVNGLLVDWMEKWSW